MKVQKIFTGLLLIALGTGLSGCYTQFSGLDRLDNDYNDRQYNLSTQEVGGYYDWSAGESAYEGENYIASQPEKPYLYQDEYFDNESLDKEAQLLQSGIQIQDTETRDWYAENGLQGVYWEGYDEGFDEGYDYGYEDGYDQGSNEVLNGMRSRQAGDVYTSGDFGYDQRLFEEHWGTRWGFQYRFNYALAHSYYATFGNLYPQDFGMYAFYRYRNPSRLSVFANFGNGCVGFNNWQFFNGPYLGFGGNFPCNRFGAGGPYGWGFNNAFGFGWGGGWYSSAFGFGWGGGWRGEWFYGQWDPWARNFIVVNNYYNNQRYGRTRSELYRLNPRSSGLYSANDGRTRSSLNDRNGRIERSGLRSTGVTRSRSSAVQRSSSRSRGAGSSGITRSGRSSSNGRSSSGVGRSRSGSSSSGSSGVGRSRSGGSSSGSSGRSSGSSGSSSGKRGGGSLSSAGGPDGNSGYRPSTEARIARTNTLLRQKNSALTARSSSVRSSRTNSTRSSSVNRGTSSLNSRISNLLQSKRSSQASSSVRSRVSSPVKRTSVFRAPSSSGSRVRTSTNNAASRVRSATRSANTSRSSTVRRSSSSSRSSSVRRSGSSSSGSSRSSSGRSRSGGSSSSKRGGR